MTPAQPDTYREQQLRLIIRDEVTRLIEHHEEGCLFRVDQYPARVRKTESQLATLIGAAAVSAGGGGVVGALLSKLL